MGRRKKEVVAKPVSPIGNGEVKPPKKRRYYRAEIQHVLQDAYDANKTYRNPVINNLISVIEQFVEDYP